MRKKRSDEKEASRRPVPAMTPPTNVMILHPNTFTRRPLAGPI